MPIDITGDRVTTLTREAGNGIISRTIPQSEAF